MAIYNDGGIDFVVDNRGRYWIIDPVTRTRYETGGPTSGSFKAAAVLYGSPRNVDTMLSGWNEYPGGAVTYFGGPNEMEKVIAGLKPDPFTGYTVPDPQEITTGSGETFAPEGQAPTGEAARYEQLMQSLRYVPSPGDQERIIRQAGLWDYHVTYGRGADGAGGGSGDPTSEPSREQRDAFASTQRLLEEYELPGLTDEVREWINEGYSAVEIAQLIRDTDEFKARYPGLAGRLDNGYAAITPGEYLSLERAYKNIMRNADLPPGFYDDPDDFANFIANDVSAAEMEARVADGIIAAQTAPPEVREALSRFYGVGNSLSALAAYYLDPDRGIEAIQREFRAAAIGGAAQRTTWGELSRAEAEGLEALGLSGQQAQQGFTDLASQKQLMSNLPGEVGSEEVTRTEQLDARFGGDAEAMDEIRRQRERRVSAFAGQVAGATSTTEGVTGLRNG